MESSVITELLSPPKPPLAFRVGVVGHRPDRLGSANQKMLSAALNEILVTVRDEVNKVADSHRALYADAQPQLVALSPLAEGTDRLFAEEALELDWDLCCVMPFRQQEYERDFAPDTALEPHSLPRFHRILQAAADKNHLTRLELDCVRGQEGMSPYGLAGNMVVGMSDLLVAVWDGDRSLDKRGGTAETIAAAHNAGTPTVVIDAKAPHGWLKSGSLADLAGVQQAVSDILSIPQPFESYDTASRHNKQPRPEDELLKFYGETRPRWKIAVVWKLFRDLVGGKKWLPKIAISVIPFEQAVLKDWPLVAKQAKGTVPGNVEKIDEVVDRLRPFYAWPDKLADLYADFYRSSFLTGYFLAALAVGLALLPVGLGHWHLAHLWGALEFGCILGIILLFLSARRGRWHERWLDYRLAAELIRHLRLVAPIGGQPPFPHVPTHHAAHGQPEATWMNWYLRAVTRAVALRSTVLDTEYLKKHLEQLEKLLEGQKEFHSINESRSEAIDHRLHIGIGILLGLTLLSCGLHLVSAPLPSHLLIFLCGVLPAVRDLSEGAADLLLREVLDWRVLFLDRPPELGP